MTHNKTETNLCLPQTVRHNGCRKSDFEDCRKKVSCYNLIYKWIRDDGGDGNAGEENFMKSEKQESQEDRYLIKNTTRAQREKIVRDSIGNCDGNCDGCACGLGDEMYQDYIDGKKELKEISMEFRRGFVK